MEGIMTLEQTLRDIKVAVDKKDKRINDLSNEIHELETENADLLEEVTRLKDDLIQRSE
jgi:uncharacterized protein YoxC